MKLEVDSAGACACARPGEVKSGERTGIRIRMPRVISHIRHPGHEQITFPGIDDCVRSQRRNFNQDGAFTLEVPLRYRGAEPGIPVKRPSVSMQNNEDLAMARVIVISPDMSRMNRGEMQVNQFGEETMPRFGHGEATAPIVPSIGDGNNSD